MKWILAIMLALLTGCGTMKQSMTKVTYTKGCHIEVTSAYNEKTQSAKTINDVKFADCEAGGKKESEPEIKPDGDNQ